MAPPENAASATASEAQPRSNALWKLFLFFLRTGVAYGGGTGITALIQEEFVVRRKSVTRAEFLALYGIGRIIPSGTSTTMAVAYGYRANGLIGTVIALVAMILPSFTITVFLTILYELIIGTPVFDLINLTLMPAALAVVITSTLKLGQPFFRPSVELLLMIGGFVATLAGFSPSILVIVGGVIGAVALRGSERDEI